MGLAWSNLALGDTDSISNLSPNQADWLTCHADVTGLAVVEVERLWHRFKQLTGSADQVRLNPTSSALPNELSNDIFVRNVRVKEKKRFVLSLSLSRILSSSFKSSIFFLSVLV